MKETAPLKSCPDCHGELESGAIMDNTYGAVLVQMYGRNSDEAKGYFPWVVTAQFEDVRKVITYRCQSCNRLFSYANNDIVAKNAKAIMNRRIWLILLVLTIFSIIYVSFMYY